ncbi:uncharacterized protein B0T15DRAFT_504665 [Chaetomium strumarium]|uniref:Fungal N-terminal domain-containing protein n=1 Tax=Chaetomium strumarium TaxID=1170767 RepID=A0AAJ0GP01_9PEZI|nr:hypothetical protein B0T15DRAFT_504665 [Chaetomium strumarium]
MDPLSVAASIGGLLSAAGAVAKLLGPYVAAIRDTPEIAVTVHTEVQATTIILSALQSLAQNMASVPVQRAALVQVDQLIAILTDGVLLFSHLEATVGSLLLGDSPSPVASLDFRFRLQWARKETELTSIVTRLQGFKASISLMLGIFQSDSAMRAEECREQLTSNVRQLLESNRDICHRLAKLEDFYDAQSLISNRRGVAAPSKLDHAEDDEMQQSWGNPAGDEQSVSSGALELGPGPPGTPSFAFESDLEASTAYRRAQRETVDFSFRSSVAWSNGLSAFSRLTFGDVSVLSVIALPIHADEISNSHHYTFGGHLLASLPAEVYTRAEPNSPVTAGRYADRRRRASRTRCIVM